MLTRKVFLIPLLIIITSLYLFPFICSYIPIMNTKMALAAFSLLILGIKLATNRTGSFEKHMTIASIYGMIVSLMGIVSVVYNDATDYTYASYIMSMWVWLGAAYVVINMIKLTHGSCTIVHICNYIIAVCVIQCIIALMVDSIPAVKQFVDGFVEGEGFMGTSKDRMYGIGASLDVAGMKFAGSLVMIAVLLKKIQDTQWQKYQTLYILAFLFITVVGSMIGRTTYVGVILSVGYWLYLSRRNINIHSKIVRIAFGILLCSIILVIYLYNTIPEFRSNIRFAFEGFFSLVEKGHWETNSNNRLATMVVWPDNMKTWIIGDGYFNNPLSSNDYYIGAGIGEFYMNTDIGYCRFIFYFGVIGLVAFIAYFIKVCKICCVLHRNYMPIFVLIVVANFIIWSKVASDLFVLLAPFMLITQSKEETIEEQNIVG